MKILLAAVPLIYTVSASAQIFRVHCQSKMNTVSMSLMPSNVNGEPVSDVNFQRAGQSKLAIEKYITNAEPNSAEMPDQLSFFVGDKLVHLKFSISVLDIALDNGTALLSYGGHREEMYCKGSQGF